LIRETSPAALSEDHTEPPAYRTSNGEFPTRIEAATFRLRGLIFTTRFVPYSFTHTAPPPVTMPHGALPTLIALPTARLRTGSIVRTVPCP
jgi:hypothetical protein